MKQQPGFTLIELVVVIIILGLLSVVALPRFMNASHEAKRNIYLTEFSAFISATRLYHAGWKAAGHTGAVIDLVNFGDGDVDSSETGWPMATSLTSGSSTTSTISACMELWTGLTQSELTLTNLDQIPRNEAELAVSTAKDGCVFIATYFVREGINTLQLNYSHSDGITQVTVPFYPMN